MNRESVIEAEEEFLPGIGLSGAHVQSLLSSSPWRGALVKRRTAEYRARSRREVVDAGGGVRLLGYRARSTLKPARGLVILLHGWEGSADSNYLLSAADTLDRTGFDTFRLNFRDHGESHHLNEGLFHSCRLEEVLGAAARLAGEYRDGPVFIAGFSLGGNFALRIARHAPARGLGIERVVAISPVIRPHHVLDALERGLPLYRAYFTRKWRRSLQMKQMLYPERYNFSEWFRLQGLREQTRYLVEHHTDFPNLDAYLEGYSVAGDFLAGLETPALVITAADDPIIPVSDFQALPRPRALDLKIHAHGGHCGFLENWRMECWVEKRLVKELCHRPTRR